jgi:hypothetical protein
MGRRMGNVSGRAVTSASATKPYRERRITHENVDTLKYVAGSRGVPRSLGRVWDTTGFGNRPC